MKNILCKIFGHAPPVYSKNGWYSPGNEYAKIVTTITDGLGVRHSTVESTCPRCGEEFRLCRIHLPD